MRKRVSAQLMKWWWQKNLTIRIRKFSLPSTYVVFFAKTSNLHTCRTNTIYNYLCVTSLLSFHTS
jgi:hypothetical protein